MCPSHIAELREDSSPSLAGTRAFLAGIAVLVLAHLLTSFHPSILTSGIDYWSEIPLWARYVLVLAGAAGITPRAATLVVVMVERLLRVRRVGWMGLALAGVGFVALQSHGYAYGDGYSYRAFVLDDRFPQLAGNLALMGGDLLVRWCAYHFVVLPLGGSLDLAIAITGAVAGVLSVTACVQIVRSLWPGDARARRFVLAASFSSGAVALWFGHAEAYALANAVILWALALAIRAHGKTRGLVTAWLVAFIAILLHALAIALIPVMLWTTLRQRTRLQSIALTRKSAWVFLSGAVLACGLLAALVGRLKPGILVPLLPGSDSSYSLLSIAHLLDVANLLLFGAPLVFVYIIASLVQRRRNPFDSVIPCENPVAVELLAMTAFSFLLFMFWVDPLLGAFRDWDLLSTFGILLSMLAATFALRRLPARAVAFATIGLMMFAIAHTGIFVWTATRESAVMLRVDRMVREDVHYSQQFHRGERRTSWADILSRAGNRYDLAKDHMLARIAYEPADASAWRNLGVDYWFLGGVDSAAIAYRMSAHLAPERTSTWRELARVCLKQGDLPGVRDAYRQVLAREDTSYSDRVILASACIQLKRYEEARPLLEKNVAEFPSRFEAYFILGIIAEETGDFSGAVRQYDEAVHCGSNLPELRQRLTRCREAIARGS